MKVDFFIVGAPKAGTTSLYHYLNQHPEIEMSKVKEPNYFSSKSIKDQGTYYNSNIVDNHMEYHSLFNLDNKTALFGEASVSYLFYHDVPAKIKKYNESSKIIIVLRNPVERAFSHYLMDYRLGLVSQEFRNIINTLKESRDNNLFYQQYIELGKYSEQVLRYINEFGIDNVLIIDYDNFKYNNKKVVQDIYSFLGVDVYFSPDFSVNFNKFILPNKLIYRFYSIRLIRKLITAFLPVSMQVYIRRNFFLSNKPLMSMKTRNQLKEVFKEDIIKLSKILDKDFKKWLR